MKVQIYTMQSVDEALAVIAQGVDHVGITPSNIGLPGEVDNDTARAIATVVIHAFSSLAGIEGGFTLKATTTDVTVEELDFTTRTTRVLQKAGITTLSMLWFRLIQGTLLEIKNIGKKSYEEVVDVLVTSGRILKK